MKLGPRFHGNLVPYKYLDRRRPLPRFRSLVTQRSLSPSSRRVTTRPDGSPSSSCYADDLPSTFAGASPKGRMLSPGTGPGLSPPIPPPRALEAPAPSSLVQRIRDKGGGSLPGSPTRGSNRYGRTDQLVGPRRKGAECGGASGRVPEENHEEVACECRGMKCVGLPRARHLLPSDRSKELDSL